jgi:hypothetical protein
MQRCAEHRRQTAAFQADCVTACIAKSPIFAAISPFSQMILLTN